MHIFAVDTILSLMHVNSLFFHFIMLLDSTLSLGMTKTVICKATMHIYDNSPVEYKQVKTVPLDILIYLITFHSSYSNSKWCQK